MARCLLDLLAWMRCPRSIIFYLILFPCNLRAKSGLHISLCSKGNIGTLEVVLMSAGLARRLLLVFGYYGIDLWNYH